jgi:hypothetical protein
MSDLSDVRRPVALDEVTSVPGIIPTSDCLATVRRAAAIEEGPMDPMWRSRGHGLAGVPSPRTDRVDGAPTI